MPDFLSTIMVFFQPLAMTITLVYAFGLLARWDNTQFARVPLMGTLFGTAAAVAMFMPMNLSEGIIVDLRNLFVGLAAGLFGWVAGLIAVTMAIATRLYIGGSGAIAGVVGLTIAMMAGLAWRLFLRDRIKNLVWCKAALGLIISAHMAGLFLLPFDIATQIAVNIGPTLLVFNIGGAVLIGSMLHREQLLIVERDRLRFDALSDPLTELMNRRHITNLFDALPAPAGTKIGRAMLYFDVDRFKRINDTNGHLAGDMVLMEISKRVQACLREQDMFSRMGGDEFLVVLPDVSIEVAGIVAERCRTAIGDRPIDAGDVKIDVTISMGVEWSTAAPSFKTDYARADDALYRAKERGRDCIAFEVTRSSTKDHRQAVA